MGRPTKTYNRELKLVKKMKPGTAWLFSMEHPKGFMAKVYNILLREPGYYCRLSNALNGVIVFREPEPKIPKESDYINAKN